MRRRLQNLLEAEDRRAALRHHTVESLLAIDAAVGGGSWPVSWVEHTNHGYHPRDTFSATELVAEAGARLIDETTGELVADHLLEVIPAGCVGLAFAESDEPVLVAMQASNGLRLADAVELATWASAALEASPGFSAAVTHAWARSAERGALAWPFEGLRCAALCPNGHALRFLVNTLDNRSLAMVLATRLSVLGRIGEPSPLAG
jgi:hypothetical protein